MPKIRQMLSELFGGKELCASINPDEAVAYGAAVQAGVLGGGLAAAGGALAKASSELVLMDVVPLSLGIETTGRVMSTIVKRNTAIPCRKSDTFTTEEDWQTEIVRVVALQLCTLITLMRSFDQACLMTYPRAHLVPKGRGRL